VKESLKHTIKRDISIILCEMDFISYITRMGKNNKEIYKIYVLYLDKQRKDYDDGMILSHGSIKHKSSISNSKRYELLVSKQKILFLV